MRFTRSGLPVDYVVVVAPCEEWYVSREMAQAIEATLNQTPTPQWAEGKAEPDWDEDE